MDKELEQKILKYPKQIRELISSLTYNNRKLKKENEELKGTLKDTNTFKRDFDNYIYLENYSRIFFKGNEVEVMVHVDTYGKVRVEFGDGVIVPVARNCIYIINKNNEY
jgi:hypothetical protein